MIAIRLSAPVRLAWEVVRSGGSHVGSRPLHPYQTVSVINATLLLPRSAGQPVCPRATAVVPARPLDRTRDGHGLLIRSTGQVVQDHLVMSVPWADVPGLPARVRRCLPAWRQLSLASWPLLLADSGRQRVAWGRTEAAQAHVSEPAARHGRDTQ